MNSKKIGIVGGEGEKYTMHMKSVLEKLGAEPVIIDTFRFPETVSFSLRDERPVYEGRELSEIEAFYNPIVFYSDPPYDLYEQIQSGQLKAFDGWYASYAAQRERQALLGSWVRAVAFGAKRVANRVECFHLHILKPHQLSVLKRAGVTVPPTLVTNSPPELLAFREEVGDVLYKPVAGGATGKLLKDEDLRPERLELLCSAPVIFQKLHAGALIRVFVLDGRVLSAFEMETGNLDDRGNEGAGQTVDIPESVEQMCIRAAAVCDMAFASIDVKRTDSNEYFVLECSPSPAFIGFQTRSGVSIDEELGRYLIGA